MNKGGVSLDGNRTLLPCLPFDLMFFLTELRPSTHRSFGSQVESAPKQSDQNRCDFRFRKAQAKPPLVFGDVSVQDVSRAGEKTKPERGNPNRSLFFFSRASSINARLREKQNVTAVPSRFDRIT